MRISDGGDSCDVDSVGLWRGGNQKSSIINLPAHPRSDVHTYHERGKNTERSEGRRRKVPDVFLEGRLLGRFGCPDKKRAS